MLDYVNNEDLRSEDFGPCCACREEGPTVRNLCMLPLRMPDTTERRGGWGCLVCDLPREGAVAVLCDRCVSEEREIVDVINGYPVDKQRLPYASLTEPFDHDLARHSEIAA